MLHFGQLHSVASDSDHERAQCVPRLRRRAAEIAEEAAYLAEGLRDLTVIDGISTAGEYGQIIADRMEASPGLAGSLDLPRLGQRQIDEEGGEFGDRDYVAYQGTQPEIEEVLGRHIPPTQEPQIGGMAQWCFA